MNEAESRDPEKVCNVNDCNAWKQNPHDYCYHHKGLGMTTGAPENNGNAATHNLTSDPLKYKERQPDQEAGWIRSVRESILDRIRNQGREPDFLDKPLAELTAIQLHIAFHAADYIDEKGLFKEVFVEDGGYKKDIPNSLLDDFRQYHKDIYNNLKKLGVLNDPESQKANAMERTLAEVLSE